MEEESEEEEEEVEVEEGEATGEGQDPEVEVVEAEEVWEDKTDRTPTRTTGQVGVCLSLAAPLPDM